MLLVSKKNEYTDMDIEKKLLFTMGKQYFAKFDDSFINLELFWIESNLPGRRKACRKDYMFTLFWTIEEYRELKINQLLEI